MKYLLRYTPLLFILLLACSTGDQKVDNDPSLKEVKKEVKDVQVKTGAYLTNEYQEMVKEVEAYAMSTEAELNKMSEEVASSYSDQKENASSLKDSLNLYLNQIQEEGREDVNILMEKIQKTRKALEESMRTFQDKMKEQEQKKSK